MKTTSLFRILASIAIAAAGVGAASVEEIDLAGGDDSAVDRANAPKVERTRDGYIDVVCEDATIASVLHQFRRCTRMNILCGESTNLTRRVSASLNHVPWHTALQSMLGLAGFKMDERDGIWYVSEKTVDEVKNATRYFSLKHASAVDLADLFNGVSMKTSYNDRNSIRTTVKNAKDESSSPAAAGAGEAAASAIAGRAKATAYPNTNMLVLTGPETSIIECERIIRELDRPVTQVYIEARFIELSTEAMHKLGVQWDSLASWGASAKSLKAGYEQNDGTAANYGEVTSQRSVNDNSTLSTTRSTTGSQTSNMSTGGDSSANASENVSDNSNDNVTKSENSTLLGLVPDKIAEAAGAGASAASMGWKNASTFSGQLSADDFRLAISAFEQLQEGKLFSNPRIIVANGKEARVDMTTKYPYIEVTSDRSGTESQNLSVATKLQTVPGTDKNLFAGEAFFSYGITLSVKPRVSPAGLISVEVVPSISELIKYTGANRDDSGKIINDTPSTAYPVIGVKSINTEFTMKDGATAVIGGLTQTKEADVDSGIPYLRDIPWLGKKLFGWQSREKVQNEILVCVTVGIANPESLLKDAGLPTNAVLGREYVEGRRLEPGQRPDALKNITSIDTRSLDEIRDDPYRLKDEEIDLEPEAEAEDEPEPPETFAEPAEPEAAPAAEAPAPEPEPVIVIKPDPKPAPAPAPEPAPAPAPAPAPTPKAEPAPAPATEPKVESAPAPAPEPKPEPAPAPAETRRVVKRIFIPAQSEPASAPVAEPAPAKAEPAPVAEPAPAPAKAEPAPAKIAPLPVVIPAPADESASVPTRPADDPEAAPIDIEIVDDESALGDDIAADPAAAAVAAPAAEAPAKSAKKSRRRRRR